MKRTAIAFIVLLVMILATERADSTRKTRKKIQRSKYWDTMHKKDIIMYQCKPLRKGDTLTVFYADDSVIMIGNVHNPLIK